MNMVNVDGNDYDLDAVSPRAREQLEQLLFFGTDVAKLLTPAGDLPAKIQATKDALAQELAATGGDTVKLG
jgi:electron transfer flavoprotein alpha/beta subunit